MDIALFAGGSASKTYGPAAVKAGAVVIDNSSTYRYDPEDVYKRQVSNCSPIGPVRSQ